MFDLVVKGGVLPDGRQADIGIRGDRIAAVEALPDGVAAGAVIDAAAISFARPSSTRISTWMRRCPTGYRGSTPRARFSKASRCGAS
jgi:hypothetical protein